ncbi:MAG: tRNA 2-thiouridine(34) synthase MnmA [Spirochaetaceae bacterium]|nr:tRNA 2-thiouridine(34) synthase MnmA [Spirochaetaceae bacterium]
MPGKALIAMSGGVDSSVAAFLLKEEGYSCTGVTFKLFSLEDTEGPGACRAGTRAARSCCSLEDVNDARAVAYRLDMPHYVLNFTGDFRREVIGRFVGIYESGATPNPCIDCNRYIKFPGLLRKARELGFDAIATGHYARAEKSGSRYILRKSLDAGKDQSYVLYASTQEQLAAARFPLGGLTKAEVREIAGREGFANARKRESQDICFVPDRDYAAFIERYTGRAAEPGDIIDFAGKLLGRHRGLIRCTIGQRRGLGVAKNGRVYVAAKCAADNTVTLGPEESLYTRSLTAGNINLIACETLEKPARVLVKTRYQEKEQAATARQTGSDTIRVEFDCGQRAVAPGQAVVLYDGDIVVGGGVITGTE